MIIPAKRLENISEYYFSKKLKEVKKLQQSGVDIINMAIGSPDFEPPKKAIESVVKYSKKPNSHGYQSYIGTEILRKQIAIWYREKYGVELDFTNEILPLMGSKEGVFHINMAFANPQDEILIPNPGYPTYSSITDLISCKKVYYDLDEQSGFLPDLDSLENVISSKTKIMWINYPHMPTGKIATKRDLEKIVNFTQKHNILLVNDNPYSFILNENPISIFDIKNSKKNCLELNSISKTYNMAGWRVGMVCGSKELISNVLKVKSNLDSGTFLPIQMGAVEALKSDDSWHKSLNEKYAERKKIIWQICDNLNLIYDKNTAGLFVWAKLPNDENDKIIAQKILDDYHVFITPGSIFGNKGEGYIRFSLCCDLDRIIQAKDRLLNFKI